MKKRILLTGMIIAALMALFMSLSVLADTDDPEHDICPVTKKVHAWIANEQDYEEATCIQMGYYRYDCPDCESYYYKKTPALGHTELQTVIDPASMHKTGSRYDLCTRCMQRFNYKMISRIKSVELSGTSFVYNGNPVTPTVLAKDLKGEVIPAGCYTVTYANNTSVGIATAQIRFQGDYDCELSLKFKIVPPAPVLTSAKKGLCQAKLNWKAVTGASGYEIFYDVEKTLRRPMSTLAGAGKTAYTLKKLTGGLTYYFQVKAYAVVNGEKIYSEPSAVKSVKVTAKAWNKMSVQEQVVSLVNKERSKKKLIPVTPIPALDKAAAKRAAELTRRFDHTRPNGSICFTVLDEYKISDSGAGENIAAGQKDAKSVMKSWMNSPGHKANIMNPAYRHLSVGYKKTSGGYRNYWVQLMIV